MTFGSTTVSAIYKDRWQIEIFFKTLKQNLRIKTFVGTSANALKVQIWTAADCICFLRHSMCTIALYPDLMRRLEEERFNGGQKLFQAHISM